MNRRTSACAQSGQGLVEFALVGSLFFALIFSIINAGFFLYGRNAVQHAADIGVATIAAEGNYDNSVDPAPNDADQVAISRMGPAGLITTPLIKARQLFTTYSEILDRACNNPAAILHSEKQTVVASVHRQRAGMPTISVKHFRDWSIR